MKRNLKSKQSECQRNNDNGSEKNNNQNEENRAGMRTCSIKYTCFPGEPPGLLLGCAESCNQNFRMACFFYFGFLFYFFFFTLLEVCFFFCRVVFNVFWTFCEAKRSSHLFLIWKSGFDSLAASCFQIAVFPISSLILTWKDERKMKENRFNCHHVNYRAHEHCRD